LRDQPANINPIWTSRTVPADLRDYLAVERTFLAWVRTGLALMGFGFVVARFGLFLQQLKFIDQAASDPSYGLSLWFGTALIAVGVVVNIASTVRHICLVRQLDRAELSHSHSMTLPLATAVFLALVGMAMAIYLISVRGTAKVTSDNREPKTQWVLFAAQGYKRIDVCRPPSGDVAGSQSDEQEQNCHSNEGSGIGWGDLEEQIA
jgi:putative membrane protein